MEWIKMRATIATDPKTLALRRFLMKDEAFKNSPHGTVPPEAMRNFVIGSLVAVWVAVNAHIDDQDICVGLDVDGIDEMAGHVPGFGRVMVMVGWAETVCNGVRFPNFREFNSPLKERKQDRIPLSSTERVRKFRERNADETKRNENETREKRREEDRARAQERFDQFWLAYPEKVAKIAAKRAWDKLNPDDAMLARLLGDLEKRARAQWDGKLIPHAATYLNGSRWEDGDSTYGKGQAAGLRGDLGTGRIECDAKSQETLDERLLGARRAGDFTQGGLDLQADSPEDAGQN